MPAWRLARIALLATVAGLFAIATPARADPVGEKVAAARAVYEKQMEEVRDRVRSSLDRQDAQIRRRAKPDEAGLAALAAEREAFEIKGQWPSLTSASVRQQQKRALELLDRAYGDAEAVYARTKKSDLEAAIRAERTELPKDEDLAAWGPDLVGGATRDLGPGATMALGEAPAMAYRLEVVAHRTGGTGNLIIDCPLGDGKRLPVNAAPAENGELRAMLTVRATLLSADLGVERPVNLASAVADSNGRLSLRSEGGSFTVDSVRMKPLQSRAAPAPATGRARGPAAIDGQSMPVGSKWRGLFSAQTISSIEICDATVTTRTDDTIEFLVEFEKFQMTWSFRLSAGKMTLTAVTGPNPQRLNVKGSGQLEDQTISIDWEWSRQGHSKAEKGSLDLMSYELLPKPVPSGKSSK